MNRTLVIGLIITGMLLIFAGIGPLLPNVDGSMERLVVHRDASGKLMMPPYPPSEEFLLGSDWNGVDLFSRIVMGTRETFAIILSIVVLRMVLSLLLSIGAFYLKSVAGFMRTWNLLFSFLPTIFILLILLANPFLMFAEHRVFWVVLTLAVIEAGRLGTIYYTAMIDLQEKTYMEAAIACGGKRWGMFKRYYWPALKSEILTTGVNEISRTMFLIAQLGVIGVFINQKFMSQLSRGTYRAIDASNSWPTLLQNLRSDIYSAPWIPLTIFIAITLTMVGFYCLGEGIKKYQYAKLRRVY